MWFRKKKKKLPEFKLLYNPESTYKYSLKKLDPFDRFDGYEYVSVFKTYEEVLQVITEYSDFPQYFDGKGMRVK